MPIVSELILSLMLTASLSAGAPLSAPPGLAVSLPAITAQAQQLHTPLMILHAGGVTPEGVTGSNSLEALEHSYENGFRLLELDFSWTCDGELVCVHDWNAFYGRILDTDSPTLAQFEAVRDSTYGFTSLTLDHLIAWLREHPGVSIVTDIKEDCAAGAALIAQRCPDLRSRFIIQIYHPEEYDQVADLGFEHIILTVYQMSWSEKQDTAALSALLLNIPWRGSPSRRSWRTPQAMWRRSWRPRSPSSSTRSMTRRIRPPWSARASRASTLISGRPPPRNKENCHGNSELCDPHPLRPGGPGCG